MGRRERGTGSIKHQRGKSLAYLRGEYLGSFDTDELAQQHIDATVDLDAGKAPDSVRLYGAAFMVEREASGEIRGYESEASTWNNHVCWVHPDPDKPKPKDVVEAKFADWPLKRVRTPDVTAHLLAVSRKRKTIVRSTRDGVQRVKGETTLGQAAVQQVRRLLYAVFQAAVDEGKLTANPVAGAKLPKFENDADEEEDEWTFLFVEEIAALFASIEAIVPKDTRKLLSSKLAWLEQRRAFYRAVYALAVYGGLRQGEIFGLHWEDIQLEQRGGGDRRNTVQVRRTRIMGRKPKTKSSRRSVPMLAPLRAALEAWRRHGGVVKTHGKVFPADRAAGGRKPKEIGGYFSKSYDAAWETRFRKLCTDREYVTFHDLRHTCASHLVMGTWGMPLLEFEVGQWLGHADSKTTKRYMHLAPGSLADLVAQMEAASPADISRRIELGRQARLGRT